MRRVARSVFFSCSLGDCFSFLLGLRAGKRLDCISLLGLPPLIQVGREEADGGNRTCKALVVASTGDWTHASDLVDVSRAGDF